jgi:hypothetical protein
MTDATVRKTDEDQQARTRLVQMLNGYRVSAILHTAAVLGIADHLADDARPVSELASLIGADQTSLHRLLRGLAILGVVEEREPGSFALTPLGAPLRTNAPDSLRTSATNGISEQTISVWMDLPHSVKTGETAFDHVNGISAFEFFARHPEISAGFNRMMSEHTRQFAPYLFAAYDFSPHQTIIDIGAGDGTLMAAILDATPTARGVVFDTPAGAEAAPKRIAERGLSARCDIIHGDFFQSVPEGGDAYTMKSIIHDWNDELATKLLRNCRRAMRDDSKLIVLDIVLPPIIDRSEVTRTIVFSDLNMLVNTGGRERTEAEHRSLIEGAGFRVTEIIPLNTPWGYAVIEANPA